MKQLLRYWYGIQERGTKRAALPQQEPPLPTGRIAQPAPYAEALPLALPGGKAVSIVPPPKRTGTPYRERVSHRASAVLGEQAGSPSEPGRGQGLRAFITHGGYPRLKLMLRCWALTMQPMSLVRHTRGHELEKTAVLAALLDAGMPFLAQQVVLQSMGDPPQPYRRALMFQRRSILACTHGFDPGFRLSELGARTDRGYWSGSRKLATGCC